jgi:HPt (histidine-containing phosphotransfer) domain-containing protein
LRQVCTSDLQLVEELQVLVHEQRDELERRAKTVASVAENMKNVLLQQQADRAELIAARDKVHEQTMELSRLGSDLFTTQKTLNSNTNSTHLFYNVVKLFSLFQFVLTNCFVRATFRCTIPEAS